MEMKDRESGGSERERERKIDRSRRGTADRAVFPRVEMDIFTREEVERGKTDRVSYSNGDAVRQGCDGPSGIGSAMREQARTQPHNILSRRRTDGASETT